MCSERTFTVYSSPWISGEKFDFPKSIDTATDMTKMLERPAIAFASPNYFRGNNRCAHLEVVDLLVDFARRVTKPDVSGLPYSTRPSALRDSS